MNKERSKKNEHSIFGSILISLCVFIIGSIGFIPSVIYLFLVLKYMDLSLLLHWIFLPIVIYIGFSIVMISQLLISGCIIKLFNITYKPGTYTYSIWDANVFKWILICSIYTPARKLLEIFPFGSIKYMYLKMVGMSIGKNSLVGGVIKDPCVTSFGDNSTMGEYAIIYAHIHNYEKGTITVKNVKIGNNCVIGAGAIIMPGVTLEDDVIIASGAVVTQDQVLESGNIYAGIPAKAIKKK